MNILNYGADPRSLDGMSRLRCTIEITLPAKDLGSVDPMSVTSKDLY